MINKKKERLERDKAMSRLFRKQLLYRVKGVEIVGEIVDWDWMENTVTIQERVKENDDGIIFKLWTFDRRLCEIFNPSKNNLNITPLNINQI